MKFFEYTMLPQGPLKPTLFWRYVENTSVVWTHERTSLKSFLAHLNGFHKNIQLTVEVESGKGLHFLYVFVYWKGNDTLVEVCIKSPSTQTYIGVG